VPDHLYMDHLYLDGSTNSTSLPRGDGARGTRSLAIFPAIFPALLALLLSSIFARPAAADAGVVLNESLDTSVARITGSGHSAIYLSRVCPDNSPVKMRLCRPGEQGSVLSNYTTLGEDQPYEWNIVPLSVYLYGVEDPRNRPLVSSKEIKAALEERYREKYLTGLCEGKECRTSNGAEWREMVGATLERSLYIFVVKTSVEQDRALIAEFNARPNHNHFNGAIRNCADFTRLVLNTYFPGAVKPDYINDFFITSPKAAAHSFTRYGDQHPELDLRILHFAQVPGTIKRSYECRSATEEIYRSKKFLIPLGIFAWQGIPAAFSTYTLTGRFNPEHQYEAHSSVDAVGPDDSFFEEPEGGSGGDGSGDGTADGGEETAVQVRTIAMGQKSASAMSQNSGADSSANSSSGPVDASRFVVSVQELQAEEAREKYAILGTKDEWKDYQQQFDNLVADSISDFTIADKEELKGTFKKLGSLAKITVDPDGALWMILPNQEINKVGISASNIFAAGSNERIADQILLARMDYELKSPKHSRETMLEFQYDWNLYENARSKGRSVASSTPRPIPPPAD
jgi:hypothetical protein